MIRKIANWGNYPVVESDVRNFSFEDQLLRWMRDPVRFIPRGNGRCYGDASLAPCTVSTLDFRRVLSFDEEQGIFECQSGLTLDKVLEITVPRGWFLSVTPGTKFITVGGAVGSDVHGKNHHVDGAFSRHVLDMDVMVADGSILTCSRSLRPDLFEATCGGMGLTGVITRVRFGLKKIETSYIRQRQIKAGGLDELLALFETYADTTYTMAWIDCLTRGRQFGRGILITGEHARLDELPASKRSNALALPKGSSITFPFNLPGWVLNSFTVRAFNFLYYHKNIRREINNIVPYEPFFYPLDAILHWNRGYGKKGFVQYQFVIPLQAREGLVRILRRIGEKGMGSFLAVLKVLGKQESMISFPDEGYTLALDFPVRRDLFPFLDELDRIVLDHGGRLYMSKDARMKPEVLRGGYPRLQEFLEVLSRYNPDGKLSSLQSERLLLTKSPTN